MTNNFQTTINILNEKKSDYQILHNTYSDVVSEILKFAKTNGYEIADDEVWHNISIAGKPKTEVTKRISLQLLKKDKIQKKALQAQIYKKPEGNFELNMYIL